jgi:ribosomal 30S subunit maturation factor RimM
MELIKIGKIVNTHGIKGELRILSKFPYKEKIFIKNMKLYHLTTSHQKMDSLNTKTDYQ